jgi:hypothetical protein
LIPDPGVVDGDAGLFEESAPGQQIVRAQVDTSHESGEDKSNSD